MCRFANVFRSIPQYCQHKCFTTVPSATAPQQQRKHSKGWRSDAMPPWTWYHTGGSKSTPTAHRCLCGGRLDVAEQQCNNEPKSTRDKYAHDALGHTTSGHNLYGTPVGYGPITRSSEPSVEKYTKHSQMKRTLTNTGLCWQSNMYIDGSKADTL